MKSIEFSATIIDGIINVPSQYREFPASVKVVLMENVKKQNAKEVSDDGFGSLSHFANPKLWEEEKHAWENAVKEKYGSR
ncbi:MAG: hypothetical protein LBN20_00605 [Endomicrobium sp.]|jgi:hypothetical protein|nr:hypothetical protein [Endomicrobium sp.]